RQSGALRTSKRKRKQERVIRIVAFRITLVGFNSLKALKTLVLARKARLPQITTSTLAFRAKSLASLRSGSA
ncbi:MAG: hypothetical protein IKX92_04410, partial [Clostridia bacterium]|nr:hypothetical protein [Clostridia bacterium]